MRLPFLGGAIVAVACASNGGPAQVDAGDSSHDSGPDAALTADAAIPGNFAPSLLFVDAVLAGSATWAQGTFNLDDVRVCVHDKSAAPNVFMTDHAQPYDRVIPLTNYVGLQKGSGLDLGTMNATAVDIDVYPAALLQNDAAWSPDSNETCAKISCTNKGPPCVEHVRLSTTLTENVNVVAMVDDTSADAGSGVKLRTASFTDTPFGGSNGSIHGTVVDLSDWNTGQTIGAYYGDWKGASGTGAPLAVPLAKDVAATPIEVTALVDSYETSGIRFDQTGPAPGSFGQSLDSIAYVADPTVTPPSFYGVRENFVFALVGDPNDATTVNAQDGRNPSFNRNGLHIAAMPYATPRPK